MQVAVGGICGGCGGSVLVAGVICGVCRRRDRVAAFDRFVFDFSFTSGERNPRNVRKDESARQVVNCFGMPIRKLFPILFP